MLDSLQIKGFKLFRELTVPKLARLNLFVGANNSGKSCLLEAVRLYFAGGNVAVLRELVRSRDGDWEARMSDPGGEDEDSRPSQLQILARLLRDRSVWYPVRHLFHNFRCQAILQSAIEIGPNSASGGLRISLGLYRKSVSEDGITRRIPVNGAVSGSIPGSLEIAEAEDELLEVAVGSQQPTLVSPDLKWIMRGQFDPRPAHNGGVPRKIVRMVSTSGIAAAEVPFLWDNVSLTPQQGRILDCLRLIEPRIEGLAFIGQSDRLGDRIPVVKLKGDAERLPLKAMGDGLTRLFHIALAMVDAENGVLLIDEFENGLYWEVQEQLWPVIFKMAEELNVQVFATTHSNDCLKSFVNAWSERSELGSIYRLERSGEDTRARFLPRVNVSDAFATEVEVR